MDTDNVVILYEDEVDVLKRQIEELTKRIAKGTTRMCVAAEALDIEATRLAGADLTLLHTMRSKAMNRLMEIFKLRTEAALKAE